VDLCLHSLTPLFHVHGQHYFILEVTIYAFFLLTESNKGCRHAEGGRTGIHFGALKHRMTPKNFSQSVGSKSHANSPCTGSMSDIVTVRCIKVGPVAQSV
jgi:hypothetical protein